MSQIAGNSEGTPPDHRDSLTGLLNRRAFESKLADALARHCDGKLVVAVILADIDDLKAVNDKWGFWPGDEVLKRVAVLLQSLVRDEEVVCRYGGDEFFLLSTAATESRARFLAEQIETEVSRLKVSWKGFDLDPLSITTGLAFSSRDGLRTEDLINAADVDLVRKKRSRRPHTS
jgi:diguanylate cyclase (GGDEF)-like protein